MLNKSDGNRAATAKKISLDILAEHFKKLNTVSQESDSFPQNDPARISEHNFNFEHINFRARSSEKH